MAKSTEVSQNQFGFEGIATTPTSIYKFPEPVALTPVEPVSSELLGTCNCTRCSGCVGDYAHCGDPENDCYVYAPVMIPR